MSNTPDNPGEFAPRAAASGPIVPKTANEALRPEAGTPPPKRSRASRSQFVVFLNFLVSLVMLVVLGAGIGVYFGRQAFIEPGPSATGDTFLVKQKMGVADIAD